MKKQYGPQCGTCAALQLTATIERGGELPPRYVWRCGYPVAPAINTWEAVDPRTPDWCPAIADAVAKK